MPAASSTSAGPPLAPAAASHARPRADSRPALPLANRVRLLMVLFGFIPFLHAAATAMLLSLPAGERFTYRTFLLGLAMLYLVPPIVVRAALLVRPLPPGRFGLNSWQFLLWWFTAQWQVIFNRLPVLEELIRLIPGFYSMWMRLWGARVGGLVYWSPGLVILDRPLVNVGSRVVFGVGVRVNPHVIAPDDAGQMSLSLAPVTIGSDTLVGGYSFLPAGARVADGELVPGMRTLRMFSLWRDGRRADGRAAAAAPPDACPDDDTATTRAEGDLS